MSKDKAKAGKKFSSRMQGARAVWVAVGILALAFLVGVLAPAWYFAGRLVENNTAVRAIGELQQQPSRMQAALNSIQDRSARARIRARLHRAVEARHAAVRNLHRVNLTAGGGVSIGGFGSDDDVQTTIDEMTAGLEESTSRRSLRSPTSPRSRIRTASVKARSSTWTAANCRRR